MWGSECEATHKDVRHLRNTREEADTKILFHVVDTAVHGATEIYTHSPDANVSILSAMVSRSLHRDEFYYWNGSSYRSWAVLKLQPYPRTKR